MCSFLFQMQVDHYGIWCKNCWFIGVILQDLPHNEQSQLIIINYLRSIQ